MSEHTPLTEAERDGLDFIVHKRAFRSDLARNIALFTAVEQILAARTSTATADTEELTQAGLYLRDAAATGNPNMEPWSFVPCAREHRPGYLCILPDGHNRAATADTGLRERVEAALDHTGEAVSCGGYSVDSDGCFVADLARRVRAALDATPASTEDRADNEGTR